MKGRGSMLGGHGGIEYSFYLGISKSVYTAPEILHGDKYSVTADTWYVL
jgi:hypothetical protein